MANRTSRTNRTGRKAKAADSANDANGANDATNTGEAADATSTEMMGEQDAQETHQLVFTLHASTGEILRIENLDPSGGRSELSDDEYAAMCAAIGGGASETGSALGLSASAQPAAGGGAEEAAYYQGIADYVAAVSAAYGLSAEELAYYQGMADYAAAIA